jgi:Pyruvate/2-oxoacid:ferredoxin oxidoreductase gamma subunit
MRGGTAHCHVNISEDEIGSPLVSRPTVLMSLNQPSMEKFEHELVPGGLQIRNVSMIPAASKRTDIVNLDIPASEIADKLGNPRAANMVMLGAYAGYTGMLQLETCLAALPEIVKKKTLVELNRKAVEAGYEEGKRARKA